MTESFVSDVNNTGLGNFVGKKIEDYLSQTSFYWCQAECQWRSGIQDDFAHLHVNIISSVCATKVNLSLVSL